MSFSKIFTPKRTLVITGWLMLMSAAMGFYGSLVSTFDMTGMGAVWWLKNAENFAHLILAVVSFMAVVFPDYTHKPTLVFLGVTGIVFGATKIYAHDLTGSLYQDAAVIVHYLVSLFSIYVAAHGVFKSVLKFGLKKWRRKSRPH